MREKYKILYRIMCITIICLFIIKKFVYADVIMPGGGGGSSYINRKIEPMPVHPLYYVGIIIIIIIVISISAVILREVYKKNNANNEEDMK